MYVEQIMTREVDTTRPEVKLSHLAQTMREKGRRFLPVVDDEGRMLGLVSHRELQRAEPSSITTLSAGEVNYLMSKVTAQDVMTREVISCAPDTLVEEAGHLMREKRIGCLPVMRDGRLAGIVTDDDILDFFLDITGCSLHDTTRIAVHLADDRGTLGRLLDDINELGAYIATVVSPVSPDDSGERVVILRYRAADPQALDQALRAKGYDLITEVLPE